MASQPTTTAQRLVESTSMALESPYGLEFSLGAGDDSSGVPDSYEGVIALDPDVLASLVIQLRTNLLSAHVELSQVKEEREELITALAIAQTKISDLKFEKEDMRKTMTDLNDLNEKERIHVKELEKELGGALCKVQEGEEAVTMLRSKVEESRRGLMRLQTEQNRRMSQLSLPSPMPMIASPFAGATTFDGLPRTPIPGTAGFPKRLSTPVGPSVYAGQSLLVGAPPKGRNPHKRPGSISEPDASGEDNSLSQQQANAARRQSMFIRPTESLLNPLGAELDALRQELVAARIELNDTQARLKEEREAREASDVCVKAFKEFIAENAIGDPSSSADGNLSIRGLTLPPLPTEEIPDTPPPPPSPQAAKKGWGLTALWGSSTAAWSTSTPGATQNAKAPADDHQSRAPSAFGRWRSGSNTSSSTSQTNSANSTGQTQTGEDTYTPAPTRASTSRRGGLFGSISSIGSASITSVGRSPPRSISSTSYAPSLEESGTSMSGTSSEGPGSPDSKLATAERVEIVQVQDVTVNELGLVRPDAGAVALEKASGEVTPTVGGRPPTFSTV